MTSFLSASLGEVKTPLNILKEVLQIFQKTDKCKAAIISYLESKKFYVEWIRLTMDEIAKDLGYCRVTISKHIRHLIEMKLIDKRESHRFPKDTANEYRINSELLRQYLEVENPCSEGDAERCKKAIASTLNSDRINDQSLPTYINQLKSNSNPNTFNIESQKMKIEEMDMEVESYAPSPAITGNKIADVNHSTTPIESKESVLQPKISKVEVNLPQRPIDPFFGKSRKSSDVIWDWIPDGPWKVENKLDTNFVDWQAHRWMQKPYTKVIDIHDARKNVRAYYKNEPTRLANDWQEYQEFHAVKIANMALREQNDVKVHEDEKIAMQKHQSAFAPNPNAPTQPNTGEMQQYKIWIEETKPKNTISPSTPVPPKQLEAEKEIDWEAIATQNQQWEQEQLTNVPDGAENPQAYAVVNCVDSDYYRKLYEQREAAKTNPQPSNAPATSERIENPGTAIANYLKRSHGMKEEDMQKIKADKAAKEAQRKIDHWDALLNCGVPNAAYEARIQAEKAGYRVENNKIVLS
jgi:hypothetical protein